MMSKYIAYKEGLAMRRMRHENAIANYIPKHTDAEYMRFLGGNEAMTKTVRPQNTNHHQYLGLFTVASQHVYGDCLRECLDKAMDVTREETK